MCGYRKWSSEKRKTAIAERRAHTFPLYRQPQLDNPDIYRVIAGACFEHRNILDSPTRLAWFEKELLDHLEINSFMFDAWMIFPNHYHLLVKISEIKVLPMSSGN